MNINVTKSAGVVLKTQGKYCAEDITVVPTLEEKSVTPTESAQEIVPIEGNCGISKVNVGAIQAYQGTATPTKSEQIINPTSNKYFSSFKVAAIPSDYIIPSGTLQITANGTKDVTNYKNVNVNVEPNLEQKTVTITENGTTDVTPTTGKDGMSKVTVTTNVPTASAVEEVATAAAMDALLVEANVGKYYKFTGTTDSNYTNGDLYLVEGAVSSHTLTFSTVIPTIDGVAITSPYTLTKDCTIVVPVTLEDTAVKINGVTYSDTATISIANQDIVMELVGGNNTNSYTVTINYTA